jgi:endoglucanase
MIATPQLVDWMVHTAEKNRIPYQREVLSLGSTEAHVMQQTRLGVLSGMLSIPCRYLHSASEMVDFEDVQNAVHLLMALLESRLNF